jgi:putative ABC transport system permease protein
MRYGAFDRDPIPAVYLPAAQAPAELICLVIRAAPGAVGLADGIQRAVHAADPTVPAMKIATIDQILTESVADRRFYTATTVVFAGLAMVLTAAGLLVVVSRSVVERRREMAIRSTLGARHGALIALLTRQGMWPALAGTAAGLVGAWLGASVIERFLFAVDPRAVWIYAGAGVLTVAIAGIACVIPARRLSRMAPSALLRE